MQTDYVKTNERRLEVGKQKALARSKKGDVIRRGRFVQGVIRPGKSAADPNLDVPTLGAVVGSRTNANMGLPDESLSSPGEGLLNTCNVNLLVFQLLPQVGTESNPFGTTSASIINGMVDVECGNSGRDALRQAGLVFARSEVAAEAP